MITDLELSPNHTANPNLLETTMDARLAMAHKRRLRAERALKHARQVEEQFILGDRLHAHPDFEKLSATEHDLRRRLQLTRLRLNKKHLSLKVMRRKMAETERITVILGGREQVDLAALADTEAKMSSLRQNLLLADSKRTTSGIPTTKAVARD